MFGISVLVLSYPLPWYILGFIYFVIYGDIYYNITLVCVSCSVELRIAAQRRSCRTAAFNELCGIFCARLLSLQAIFVTCLIYCLIVYFVKFGSYGFY